VGLPVSADEQTERLRELAGRLGIKLDAVRRAGTEGNTAGLQTETMLFSRRLDSRTFFVQNERFGATREGGLFEGSDEELLEEARRVAKTLELPDTEIAEAVPLKEQTGVGRRDPDTGEVVLEEPGEGKRLASFSRDVRELPVWSSSLLLGLTRDREIGFMQVHWPEIPDEVIAKGEKLRAAVDQGWRPPEREGGAVEAVEAGIVHSPAIGLVMDFQAAIRVIYETLDKTFGRKLTLYLDEDGSDVPMPRQFEKFEEPPIEARPTERPIDEIEQARGRFRALLLANPAYFETLGLSQETFYEEIGCIGYEPQLRRLEAVVYVKQEGGYGGNVCSAGTPEFVRFYLSFDNGATWQDQGMSYFTAYDIPGKKPLEYDVTLQIDPPERFCFFENLPLVRAILSWNNPPPANNPGFTPVWGEVQEARIQIAPFRRFKLWDLLEELKLELPDQLEPVVDLTTPVQVKKPKGLAPLELHQLYKDTDVEPHRYLFPELQKAILNPHISIEPGLALNELGIELSPLIDILLETDGNTSFEELGCVGLNPTDSALVGTITVKLSSGYSGGLCTAGSKEYVAFWIDTGAGFTYAGTTSVDVHDLAGIPPEGLQYAVFLPVDLTAHQRPCQQGPVVARVRAILSWQVPPPPGDPNFVPTWGNREETLIHIKPGPRVDAQVPFLSAMGDIPEVSIGADGKANGTAIHTGFVASDSPFGGVITVAGHISNAGPGLKYRVVRKPLGAPDTDYVPLVNEPGGLSLIVNTWDPVNGWLQTPTVVHADAQGYYPFEDYSSNHSVEGDIMMRWFSTVGEDGDAFDVRIDLSVDGNPANDVHSNVVSVLVDNTPPTAELDIDLGVGGQCADFNTGTVFTGTYTATDTHFRSFSFAIEPSGPANGALPAPAGGTSIFYGGGIGDPGVSGGSYSLDTGPMDPCGYALILHVFDRTNVNSGGGGHHSQASVGFCLRSPAP
jgi:hypothetical protein